MADGYNCVQLLGNLGADAELRMTQSGSAVLKMRLACSESYLDRDKKRQERTEWVSVVVFGKRAEGLAKHATKGTRLLVVGKLRTSSYEKDGQKRYKTEVVADTVCFAGGRGSGGESGGGSRGGGSSGASERSDYSDDDYGPGAGDDDIPFATNVTCEHGERWWQR